MEYRQNKKAIVGVLKCDSEKLSVVSVVPVADSSLNNTDLALQQKSDRECKALVNFDNFVVVF